MKPSDIFGIIVRTTGLVSAFNGVWYLAYGVSQGADVLTGAPSEETKAYFISGVLFLVGGCLLMRGADWFVRFSYPTRAATVHEVSDPPTT